MINYIKKFIQASRNSSDFLAEVKGRNLNDAKNLKVNLGQIQSFLNNQKSGIKRLEEVEFQVFSQFGDDGIIQFLINKIDIPNKIFIEFGVENYRESNTRFLLVNNKWSGLVIDGDEKNTEYIKSDIIFHLHDLHVLNAFIKTENINNLIKSFLDIGYPEEVGILSVDIDGNDYWIWESITIVNPIIVIVEYNSLFGSFLPWTIPYSENFYRLKEDANYQYWGTSISALCHLAEKKGYSFIGCNSHGNNAYFVRKDKIGDFKALSPSEGYSKGLFREKFGDNMRVLSFEERMLLIKGKPVFNVIENKIDYI